MAEGETEKSGKKEYFPPKIVHTEPLAARATNCAKSDDLTCAGGPAQS